MADMTQPERPERADIPESNSSTSYEAVEPVDLGQRRRRRDFVPEKPSSVSPNVLTPADRSSARTIQEQIDAIAARQPYEEVEEDKSSEFLGEPTIPEEKKGFPIKRTIAGGLGTIALTAAGFLGLNKINSEDNGSERPGVIITDPTLEPATQPPTLTLEPTSTPEPVREYPEFMPDAKRNIYGDTSLATDSEYPKRKECPDPQVLFKTKTCSSMSELYLREESFEVNDANGQKEEKTALELLNEGNEKVMAIAWMRLSKGLSVEEIANNYDELFAEYQNLKSEGSDVSFNIYGFDEQNDYFNPSVITIDPSYKIEYLYVPLPITQTNIELQSSSKVGFVANTVNKKLYVVIYDFSAGGIGDDSVNQAVPSEYRSSSAISWAGVLLSDKDAQTNQKVSNHSTLTPIRLELQKSFIPFKTDTLWKGIVIAR